MIIFCFCFSLGATRKTPVYSDSGERRNTSSAHVVHKRWASHFPRTMQRPSKSVPRDARQHPTLQGLDRKSRKVEHGTSAFRLRHRSKTNTTILSLWSCREECLPTGTFCCRVVVCGTEVRTRRGWKRRVDRMGWLGCWLAVGSGQLSLPMQSQLKANHWFFNRTPLSPSPTG